MDIYEIREYVTENINKIKNFHRCQCYTEKQVPYLTKEFHGLKISIFETMVWYGIFCFQCIICIGLLISAPFIKIKTLFYTTLDFLARFYLLKYMVLIMVNIEVLVKHLPLKWIFIQQATDKSFDDECKLKSGTSRGSKDWRGRKCF
jgi:hypothetical protein